MSSYLSIDPDILIVLVQHIDQGIWISHLGAWRLDQRPDDLLADGEGKIRCGPQILQDWHCLCEGGKPAALEQRRAN